MAPRALLDAELIKTFSLFKKKIAVSVKCYKAKHNMMRYVCVIILMSYEVRKRKLSSEWWRDDLKTFPDKTSLDL